MHLINKLSSLPLCPRILQWIHSYLSERSQVVAVGGELSSVKNVSGVAQGSILGPLLFIIYIDDVVTRISSSSSISLYADDIALYCSITSPTDYAVLQADISAIATWVEEERHLKLHADKCHFMLISRKRTCSIAPPALFVKAGTPLQQVNSAKYLGVLVTSSDLSGSEHIARICSKTRKLIGLLYPRFHYCSPELLLRLYKAFICPHLEYVPQVWDPHRGVSSGGLRGLEHPPKVWHNSQLSSCVTIIVTDEQQLVAKTNIILTGLALNGSFSSLLGLLCHLTRGVVNIGGVAKIFARALRARLAQHLPSSYPRHAPASPCERYRISRENSEVCIKGLLQRMVCTIFRFT